MDKSKKREVEEELIKTIKRIKKKRRNLKIYQKEEAEFKEIHKLLEHKDEVLAFKNVDSVLKEDSCKLIECSYEPFTSPGIKVFHDELIFCLFNQGNCSLSNFINCQEKFVIFGLNESIPSEDIFRKLLAYHINENLVTDIEKCTSVSLYVLYLMSVHEDSDFVSACFDFLKLHPFHLHPEDIFPIFINFGAKQEELFNIEGEELLEKFKGQNESDGKDFEKPKFPYFNMEKIGQILLYYITENFIIINSQIKALVKGLAKITLEPKIRSLGSLKTLYSTLLTTLCLSTREKFKLKEIASWVHLEEEHLLNQLEICRVVSKAIFPHLHEVLVLQIISVIIKTRNRLNETPIKINYLKLLLRKLSNKELSTLEIYSILQLINGLLPGLTATVKDSCEINTILDSLKWKISKTENSVDLIRLKLEIAKVGNLVTNNTNNRFTVDLNLEEI